MKQRGGVRWYGDSEVGDSWQVYPAGTTDEQIAQDFDLFPAYNGPGMQFHSAASIRRCGSRVLVTQTVGVDC